MPTVTETTAETTETTPAPAAEVNGTPNTKPAAKKKTPAAKKKPAAPAAKAKANTAPKSKPMPDGKSVKAGEPKREPHWNERRVAVVKAMREMKATDPTTAKTATEIADRAAKKGAPELKDRPDLVKIIGDVYRTNELVHNGFIKTVRLEGERELRYYLTAKGLKTTFPVEG